jgi:16S rRNA C1402 (ribose-2'-O) methylase RsmI
MPCRINWFVPLLLFLIILLLFLVVQNIQRRRELHKLTKELNELKILFESKYRLQEMADVVNLKTKIIIIIF